MGGALQHDNMYVTPLRRARPEKDGQFKRMLNQSVFSSERGAVDHCAEVRLNGFYPEHQNAAFLRKREVNLTMTVA